MCLILHLLALKTIGMNKLLILLELLIKFLHIQVKLFFEAEEFKKVNLLQFLWVIKILAGIAFDLEMLIHAERAVTF